MGAKALLISLSNIGDAVMTTPVLQAVHQTDPALRIDIVADQRSSEIFTHCPYRGQVILRDKRTGWFGTVDLVRRLRRTRYEVVVDLRTDGLAYLLRGARRFTRWRAPAPAGPHAVQRHMAVIAVLAGPEIPPCRVWLSAELEKHALSQVQASRYLVLAPGANWPGKCWPVSSYRALVERTRDLFERVVLLGNEQDRALGRKLAEGLGGSCLDLSGRTGLLQAAAILAGARAFVGNDSGLGHLGAAVGAPTLTVFGPGDPGRYRPWGARANVIIGPDNSLEALDADAVAAELRAHLAQLEK